MLDTSRDAELRAHKRLQVRKAARLSIDGVWRDCVILDVSGSGACIGIDPAPMAGQAVVLIDDDLGMIAATVLRQNGREVSIEFGVSDEAKQELADKLTASLNAPFLS